MTYDEMLAVMLGFVGKEVSVVPRCGPATQTPPAS